MIIELRRLVKKKASEWFGRFIAKWATDSEANFPHTAPTQCARLSAALTQALFSAIHLVSVIEKSLRKIKLEVWSVRRAHAKKKEFQTLSAWHISMINGHSMSCFFFHSSNISIAKLVLSRWYVASPRAAVTVYCKYENRGDRERNREISSETGLTDSFWYSVCSLATSRRQRSQTSARLRGA